MIRFGRLFAALVALVLAAALFAGCGDDDVEPVGSPTPTTEDSTPVGSPSPDETSTTETVELEVWFTQDGDLFLTHREVPETQGIGKAALEALLAGPSDSETDVDVVSAIPEGSELLGLSISEGVATVDLTGEFESGGGSASMFARLSQVVYTLTQFPTVDGVMFKLDGESVETFSGEGILLDGPQTRKDYKDQLPAIVVEEPAAGEEVTSPLTISGTANTFEATVEMRLVGPDGKVIAHRFTTATCGTGCRGDYETQLKFKVSEPTEAILEVYESSAEDGSRIHVERVPVTLVP